MGEVRKKYLLIPSILVFGLFYCLVVQAAATIFLIPDQGEYVLKSNFSVKVLLKAEEPQSTQVSASLVFEPTNLQVVSLNLNNSKIKKWLVEPSYSNAKGIISFIGILNNENQNTIQYNLLEVTFKPIKLGKTSVQINFGKVIDEQDYNTVGSLGSAEFNIIESQASTDSDNQALNNNEIKQVNKSDIIEFNQSSSKRFDYNAFLPLYVALFILLLIIVLVIIFLQNRPIN
ncbi:MAG: hypothetical protein WC575_00395 [Patescibacteria group bacterium]